MNITESNNNKKPYNFYGFLAACMHDKRSARTHLFTSFTLNSSFYEKTIAGCWQKNKNSSNITCKEKFLWKNKPRVL